jgi:hypothetical protein
LFFVSSFASAQGVVNTQSAEHEGMGPNHVRASLVAERFDELDQTADLYRREKTRMKGGGWSLREFYAALDSPQLSDKDTIDHLAHLERWMAVRPQSITARVAMATSLTRWAWVARGNGFAETVTPEGARLFNERIGKAQAILESAAALPTMCPQWYLEMMTVGLAQEWEQSRIQQVFERGVQFEPDYFYLYNSYANYLLPKWDGKPGQAAKFASDSADRIGGDAGDLLYYRIAAVLIRPGQGNASVADVDWSRVQRGYKALCAQYGATKYNINELALLAYLFKDASVAREQFALIGDDWSGTVWKNRKHFDRARDWSQGHGA